MCSSDLALMDRKGSEARLDEYKAKLTKAGFSEETLVGNASSFTKTNDKGKFSANPSTIRRFFKNAKNKRKKTGNLFMISCLGVPFYVAEVIQFWGMAVHQSGTGTGQR